MVKRKDTQFTDKADLLIAADKSEAIKIDHLAFSFPLANLRHCRRAGFAGKTTRTQNFFPEVPQPKSFISGDIEEYERYKEQVRKQLAEYYSDVLKRFTDQVLGFELSPMRGRGLHGYKDSMTIKANGIEVGYVGIGGQRDTVYFQISGTGCKYLFAHISAFALHHWLSKVLTVTKLSRIDLAYDDFDSNFDCAFASKAYKDGFFSSGQGGRPPVFGVHHKFRYDANGAVIFDAEMISVGQRTSNVYWRVYNKKLEQGIENDDLSWYRNEVELKKWDVDVLLNPAAAFAGLCPFAAQLDLDKGVKTRAMTKAKEACLELASRARHVRRSAGKALHDILEIFQGDIQKTIGVILPEEKATTLGIPPTYQKLIDQVIEV